MCLVNNNFWRCGTLYAFVSILVGCTLGPDYERPELDIPVKYIDSKPSVESIANLEWWKIFQDKQLQSLIETTLEENKDLGIALARIEEAYAAVTIVRSEQFPTVDASGEAGRGKRSEEIVPNAKTDDNYFGGVDLFFEIDFWGKLRRATEAQRAELLATEAAYRNVTIVLVSNVASTYFLLRDFDEQLIISKRTLKARLDSLGIIQARFDRGTVAELDVNQAQIEVAIAEVAIASLERRIIQTENALRILLGRNPGPVTRGLPLDQQMTPPEIPVGLPSELLQRRPDLIVAEEQLHAQTARIGVAEALRYPSFTLTGNLGYESTELSDLNSSDARTWNLFGNIFQPIFNAGRLRAQVDVETARTEQAILFYEQAFQQALREVEDALVAIRTFNLEYAARSRQVIAARNAARLSRARYDGGVVDYLEVLDTERTLFNAELAESDTLQQYLNSIVQLYRSLGGGWSLK
jgi:multidrug efflux system outer membrane protein